MISAKAIGLFALPAMLMAVLWVVAVPDTVGLSDTTMRLAGVLLLGIALFGVILVCRVTSVSTEIRPRRIDPAAPACNEFRRGFTSGASRSRQHPLHRPSLGVVVKLHRRRAEQRAAVSKPALSTAIAPETIETLSRRLHDRAEKLWNRRAV
jgi:hypothetical protein